MKSLKGRLLAVVATTITLCWIGSLVALLVYTERNLAGIWDGKLQSIGTKILLSIPSGKSLSAVGSGLQLRGNAGYRDANHLTFQVWTERQEMIVRAPDSPATALKPDFADGFVTTLIGAEKWRVFSVSDSTGKVTVQVAVKHDVIDAEMRRKVLGALMILTTVLALVGVLMCHAVFNSLQPIVEIDAAVRRRRKFDLTPLPVEPLPTEVRPLVESFNHLLDQLDQAVQGERRFIGDAAHELRTPLAALQAQAQVALNAGTLAEKDVAIGKLLAVVERSTRLSDQMLDLARLDAGTHAPQTAVVDLSELVMHVSQEFDMQAQQQRRAIQLAIAPCPIDCDVDEIGILLRNLIDNALRYTGEGGRVRVSCGEESGGGVWLEVADDGPGVPEAEREAIFRRFHRIAGNGGRGSGIGLSLVSGIAELHRATIRTGGGLDGRGFSIRVSFPAP